MMTPSYRVSATLNLLSPGSLQLGASEATVESALYLALKGEKGDPGTPGAITPQLSTEDW